MATEKKAKTTTKKATARKTAKKTTKKAVTKAAAAPKRRTRKPPEPDYKNDPNYKPLQKSEIEQFARLLLEMRQELVGNVDQMRSEALKENRQNSSGDLSSMPIHMADIGTDNYEQEFTLGLIESERKMLKDIDHAIAKINNNGEYGICEATGQPIGRIRLEAKPYARYCIDYARKLEQGLIKEVEETEDATP